MIHGPAPIPHDFAANAAHMSATELCRHYGFSRATTARMIRNTGVTPPKKYVSPPSRSKPIPDDFAAAAPLHTLAELAGRYNVNPTTVQRWLRETGIKTRGGGFKFVRHPGYANLSLTKTYGDEDRAADTLRRFGMVCRCDERGRADHKGTFWRFGNTVLTPAELIQRAERKAPRGAGGGV